MKQHICILTIVFSLIGCNQNDSTTTDKRTDTLISKIIPKTLQVDKQEQRLKKLTFKNITEVVQYKESNAWIELKHDTASLALHFSLDNKDTICVSYSPECWLMYPFNPDNNKIIVYWDNFIDSKYDFEIVKAINQIDTKYIGEPFMVLELENDTTLKATYPVPDLIRKINSSSKVRTFFPHKFVFKEFYI